MTKSDRAVDQRWVEETRARNLSAANAKKAYRQELIGKRPGLLARLWAAVRTIKP